jgi:hypothetical protein
VGAEVLMVAISRISDPIIIVECQMGRSMQTCCFVIISESMIIQYSVPGVRLMRMPHLIALQSPPNIK